MPRAVFKPSSLLVGAAASVAIATASLALPSGVTYDPYAWLIWGRDLAHLTLVTTGVGTSWKPLPSLVNALFAPLGHAQPGAWLVVARAGGLFAAFMAFRVARRLAPPPWGLLAGVGAAATLLLAHEMVRRTAVGNSEALATAFGLLAIERHLDDHRTQAFALVVAAGLIRPEAWLFVLGYGGWLWFARGRPPRWTVASLAGLVPLLWFGGDLIGSGRLSTGSDRALHPLPGTPAVSPHPAIAVFQEAWTMLPVPARGAFVLAVVWAIVGVVRTRSPRALATLALAVFAVAWTAVVAAMAQRGYPGLPRFLFPAIGLAAVVAGVGAAQVVAVVPAGVPRLVRPAAALAVVAAFALLAVPDAGRLGTDAAAVDQLADRDAGLAAAVKRFGGAEAVLACGHPYTGWYAVTALAWDLNVQTGAVEDWPHGRHPVVFAVPGAGSGLRTRFPLRHMRVAGRYDGWNVSDRCPPARLSTATLRARRS